jgi:hypothetical protein
MHIAPTTIVAIGGPEGLGAICTPGGCVQIAVLLRSALVALSGIVGVLAALSYLSDARASYLEERQRVRAETDALESFADEVRGLPADSPARAAPGAPIALTQQSSTGVEPVREAYRETVMAVDHYEEDYDEPLPEHMRSEFGPDVTNAVLGSETLQPGLKRGVVAAAESCIAEREAFLEELAAEMDAVESTAGPLRSIQDALADVREEPRIASFDTLVDRWRRLGRLETACTEVVDDRRASLADRDAFDLAAYLYSSVGPPYPVLAGAASLTGEIREERRQTTDMLTRVV